MWQWAVGEDNSELEMKDYEDGSFEDMQVNIKRWVFDYLEEY